MSDSLASPAPGWLAEFGRPMLWIGGLSMARNVLALTPALYVLEMNRYAIEGARGVVFLGVVIAIATAADAALTMLDRTRRRILQNMASVLENRLGAAQMRRALAPQAPDAPRPAAAMLGHDLDALRRFAAAEALPAMIDVPFAVLFVAVLAMIHWSLGLVGLAGAAAQATWLALDARVARPAESHHAAASLAYEFGDAITRHADCAGTMGLGAALAAKWRTLRAAVQAGDDAARKRATRWENAASVSRAVSQFVILAAAMVLVQHRVISAGAAFVSFLLLGQALKPIIDVTTAWRSWLDATQAAARLREPGHKPPEDLGLQQARGELTLEGVAWTPPGALRPALRGITLKIEAGAVLAVIGPSAAGKSTLARALCGALRPAQGVVRLDGIELGMWSEALRGAAIGYLPQDVALFPGTIAENIARFGSATEFQIVAAARLAGVHEMIRQLPDSYRTVVDDRAGPLSAGQRQRVALARAMLGDPPVLVLDEPDASLDAEGEAALIACMIEARRRRRTVVMITHNTGLVRVADFVATMVGGHVMKVQRTSDVLGRPAMLKATG